jgi:hypothetical protein
MSLRSSENRFRDIEIVDAHRKRARRPAPDEAIKNKAGECSEARAAAFRLGPYEDVRFEYIGFAAIATSVWHRDR